MIFIFVGEFLTLKFIIKKKCLSQKEEEEEHGKTKSLFYSARKVKFDVFYIFWLTV